VNLIDSYNYWLVALSVLIAMCASYAALDLAGRVTATVGRTRTVWLLGGAVAMGTGIWSMHYIGMLAFMLPVPVAYHWPTVLLSLFAAIVASAIALYVVSRQRMNAFRALAGSILMGAGIASMHYIGMDAMRLPAMCMLNSFLVVLSVVFAVLISLAALWITFHFRDEKAGRGWGKTAGAVVMGAAIPVMHYTGMEAASFTLSDMPVDLSHAVSISTLGTLGIAALTLVLLGLALLTSWLDRRFALRTLELQGEKLKQSEAYLSEAQRLSHTGSFGWNVLSGEIYWSEETFQIFQYDRTTKPTVDLIQQRVHPEDAAFVKQTIERASQDGKDFDFEYRLLMPDGFLKRVHVVAHALEKSGGIEFVGAVMDVTEQREAKTALEEAFDEIKKSEDRLRTVIDTIPGMVWSGLPDGTFDFINRPWLRYLGCSWEELSARGGLRSIVHPDDLEGSDAKWSATRATGSHTDHELRMRQADGQYRWFLTRALPLHDEQGKIVRWYGTATDIDDLKQAEAGLREQASLLNLTHDSIFVRDMNDTITYWNRGAEEFYGWAAAKARGKITHQLLRTVFPVPVDEINAELLRTGRWEGELVHTKADGTHVVVASRWALQSDAQGNPLAVLETNNDITGSKQAAQALQQQANLLEQTHDAILIWEFPSTIVYWNRGAEELYGFSRKEAIGRPSHEVLHTEHPLTTAAFEAVLERDGQWRGELTHTARDGRKIIVESRHVLMRETEGRRLVLETNRDITERKLAAEALREALSDLAHVNRVTTMGELTASLAHEVNQPITAAVTNANTCVRWLAGDTPNIEEARDAAIRSAKDGTRAGEIIGRIRLLFKKGKAKRELVDVNEVIREMIVLLSGEALRYSVLIQTDLAADLSELMADRVQLQQVMMNLIMNSFDAMKDVAGRRELFIKSGPADDEQLLVSVSDTGVGLPGQQAGEIFNAFFTTKLQGTGLGLSISRSIVESHGGRLWADGNSPHGATFHFALPTRVEAD
jgi:PAS domain S-box-containing protein